MKHVDPYLSATELGIGERERALLIEVAHDLMTEGYDEEEFNMGDWRCCIWGHMAMRCPGLGVFPTTGFGELAFYGQSSIPPGIPYSSIEPEQAAAACYNFLTTKQAKWSEVLGV
jgi:hypothetical protein